MARPKSENPSEITVGDVFRRVRVTQLWVVIGSICALLAASFSLGHYVSDLQAGRRKQIETMSDMKQEFFIRSFRYLSVRDADARASSDESRRALKTANDMLVALISKWWTSRQTFEGILSLQPEIIRKSADPTKSKIVFADGTDWVIPPEIKQQVLDKEAQH
jgi:hypothetical protein